MKIVGHLASLIVFPLCCGQAPTQIRAKSKKSTSVPGEYRLWLLDSPASRAGAQPTSPRDHLPSTLNNPSSRHRSTHRCIRRSHTEISVVERFTVVAQRLGQRTALKARYFCDLVKARWLQAALHGLGKGVGSQKRRPFEPQPHAGCRHALLHKLHVPRDLPRTLRAKLTERPVAVQPCRSRRFVNHTSTHTSTGSHTSTHPRGQVSHIHGVRYQYC